MPLTIQAIVLLLIFIVPGFVFVEVDNRRRPAQKLEAFDKTVLSVLFSTILHAFLLWPILLLLLLSGCNIARLFDPAWVAEWGSRHPLLAYACVFLYFVFAIVIATVCGRISGTVTRTWTPTLSRIVRRDKTNWVLVQMKNGDFYTGILQMIPADYEVLQGPAKDFTIIPPGRYKPKGRPWQEMQDGETVLLNTVNVDAIRILHQ